MRRIERSAAFKRDYKREAKGKYRTILDKNLQTILAFLLEDIPLADRYRDHALIGNWSGCRECHIKPDLLLVYIKDDDVLQLIRLGSHSEIFG